MAEQPTIVVRGEATREVQPERAVFSVTLTARDRDRDTVVARLAERSESLRALLDGYDTIARRETGVLQVFQDLKRGSEKTVAFTGNLDTTVILTDFAGLGELMLRLGALDHATIAGPWWQLEPGSRAGAEVRRQAIADALARAREYAEAVGARIDRLVEIADDGAMGVNTVVPARAFVARDLGASPRMELDPQLQTVQASVVVRVTITEPTALGNP
jgi:uncharacterized protein YggE